MLPFKYLTTAPVRLLYKKPWPMSKASAPMLDGRIPVEEESSPFYSPANFYPAYLGEVLNDRYQIATKLGHGARSTIWLARDLHQWRWSNERYVAVKINAIGNRVTSPQHELEIHQFVSKANPRHRGWEFVRQLRDSFVIDGSAAGGGHVCLVFEPLRESLNIYKRRFRDGVIPSIYLKITLQMILHALDYLHSECQIIHTDLKPGNIMVVLEDKSLLDIAAREEYDDPLPQKHLENSERIIYLSRSNYGNPRGITGLVEITDLGLAKRSSPGQINTGPIQAELYRTPEVILDAGYSYSADIWSLGVMLWDSIQGKDLFHDCALENYDDEKHLAYITALLGPPPMDLVRAGRRGPMFYTPEGCLRNPDLIPSGFNFDSSLNFISGEEKRAFIRFVNRMIKWNPTNRSTAKELLQDPYLYQYQ